MLFTQLLPPTNLSAAPEQPKIVIIVNQGKTSSCSLEFSAPSPNSTDEVISRNEIDYSAPTLDAPLSTSLNWLNIVAENSDRPGIPKATASLSTPLDTAPITKEQARAKSEQLVTKKMKTKDWIHKHLAIEKKAQTTTSQLQFFGDSITAFMSDSNNLDAFRKNYSKFDPQNFGIPGDTTPELLWRINHGELQGHPKAVVLLIGTNDLTNIETESPHDIAQNIADIVKSINAIEPQAKVLLVGILPRGVANDAHSDSLNKNAKQVNTLLASLDNGNSVRFVDIGSKFVDGKGVAREDLLPDHLHPSLKGYQVWSDAIKPVLETMLP